MDKLSVQQKSPKEEKAAAYRNSKGKKGKKSKGTRNEEQQPQMKVVYISNPMRVTLTASEFKDRVQELTGRHADVADIFLNSSSDHAYGSSSGAAGLSPGAAGAGCYSYSPCSSSSHEDVIVAPASAEESMAQPGDPPQVANQAELMDHRHLDQWRGGRQMDPGDDASLFKPLTTNNGNAYYAETFDSHLLGNHSLTPAVELQQPPAHRFESPLADVFRRLADGRP